jgi:hypothetical protein
MSLRMRAELRKDKNNFAEIKMRICSDEQLNNAVTSISVSRARYKGIGLVWTAIFLLLIILIVGLSLDTAKVALVMHQLHNAADASALAGGPWAPKDQMKARQLAKDMAALNYADHVPVNLDLNVNNDPNGDIILGKYTYDQIAHKCYFIPYEPCSPTPIPVNAIAVIASRDDAGRTGHLPSQEVSLNFGPVAGVGSVPVSGFWQGRRGPYAIALTNGGAGAGLICLRRDGTGLHVQGTADLTVNNITDEFENGAIQINSFDDGDCMTTNGGPIINSDIVNICANSCSQVGNFDFSETDTQVYYHQPPMPDPLKWLNEEPNKPTLNPGPIQPTIDITNDTDVPDDPIPPGYYPGGMTFKGGTADKPIRLGSGVFVLDGAGLQVLAGSYVVADPEGVFFYITGEGSLYVSGNAYINATPLQEGPYAGIIMAQDDEDLNDAEISGTGDSIIEGTLYFPQHRPADQQKKGNGEGFALRLGGTGLGTGNQVIADSVYIFGTGDKIINYDGRNHAPITDAYLVE